MVLTDEQRDRYARQILLEEVGRKGQEKLLAGSVLVVGLGGLGSPASLYLAAAGVGTVGVADADVVARSNLQRQVIHATADLGKPKTGSAAASMRAVNPDVHVATCRERLTAANALEIIGDYDFVLDCTDNFASKFLLADACHLAGKPYSHAGILRFDGQLMTVRPGRSACYRCVFSAPPPDAAVPSSSEVGVLGVVPGVVGTLQATEALKYLLGQGGLLTDRLLVYDGLRATFREVPVTRQPTCPLCGDASAIRSLQDPERRTGECAGKPAAGSSPICKGSPQGSYPDDGPATSAPESLRSR